MGTILRRTSLHALRLVVAAGVVAPAPATGTTSGLQDAIEAAPPRTPRGLAACAQPLAPTALAIAGQGERIEYDVEILGIEVGTVEMSTARHGRYQGEPVTEYRGELRVDKLLAALMPLEGAAATLVSDAALAPVQASHRYRWAALAATELQTFADGGRSVASKRRDNNGASAQERRFHAPVQDLLSAFYHLRRLPQGSAGCSIVSANGKAYTIWLTPQGHVRLDTPLGNREATSYHVRYASDDARAVKEARLWVGTDHIPYKAEGLNRYHPVIALRRYHAPIGPRPVNDDAVSRP